MKCCRGPLVFTLYVPLWIKVTCISGFKVCKEVVVLLSYSKGDSIVFIQLKLVMSWVLYAALKRCSF